MLSSIHPLGERSRQRRWGMTATTYVVGSLAGGGLVGGVLGALGAWPTAQLSAATATALALAVCVLAAAHDASGVRVPGIRRQVDERWLVRYRGWVYGLGFGFQLGLGVATIVTTATVYATLALAFLSGSVARGLVIGAVFGLARGAMLLRNAAVRDPSRLRDAHQRLAGRAVFARRVAVAVPVVVAAVLSLGFLV